MKPQRLQELIDACRDERDLCEADLERLAAAMADDPALAEQFEASQRFDQRVRRVVQDVDVPRSLERRLLEATGEVVGREEASALAGDQAATTREFHGDGSKSPLDSAFAADATETIRRESQDAGPSPREDEIPATPTVHRRWWMRREFIGGAVGGSVAVAATIFIVWMAMGTPPSLDGESLAREIHLWNRQLNEGPDTWNQASALPFPDDHGVPAAVRIAPDRWRRLTALGDRQAVAYELKPERRRRGVLFVVQTRVDCGVSKLPFRKIAAGDMASGWSMAAWQTKGFLYVLVIQGERQPLDAYVRKTFAA